MELHHLRYFIAVAEQLSFTRAASVLRVAQPSLTRHIHNLEEELGVQLLNRSKTRVSITEEGRAFLLACKRATAIVEEGIQAAKRISRGQAGQIDVGYCGGLDHSAFLASLSAFQRRAPHVQMNLHELTPAKQLEALQAHRLDLGFPGRHHANEFLDLEWEPIASHEIVVLLPDDHALASRHKVRLEALKSQLFIDMSNASYPGSREWLLSVCQVAGFVPNIVQEAETDVNLMTFIASGLGVALACGRPNRLCLPGIVSRPLSPGVRANYCMAWNRKNDSRVLRQYLEVIRALAAQRTRLPAQAGR